MNDLNWAALSHDFSNCCELHPRAEISLEAAPAPARLATHTAALLADVDVHGSEVGNGRLVLLAEPKFQPEWDGQIRLVGFVRADLENEMVTDPLLLEVGWSWVVDSFATRGLSPVALSGTVSRSGNQSFGDISARPATGSIEIRSSWTVAEESISDHVAAWCELLAAACGLEPLPVGVVSLKPRQA